MRYGVLLTVPLLVLLLLIGGGAAGQETESETIDASGYCSNPDSDASGAVWEQTYHLEEGTLVSVEVTVIWTDDEGTDSQADTFEVVCVDGDGTQISDAGSNGELQDFLEMEGLNNTWTITVECLEAGPTPVGPLGFIVQTDPGNSWRMTFTYIYVPEEPEGPGGPQIPPEIEALYGDPLFWTHVIFMIASTYMFGLVGLLAGIKLIRGRKWEDDPSRWKRALATNRPFRAIAVHVWLVFLIAAVPLGMYVSAMVYGWENAWTSFPAVWNPWFYDITNADNVSLIVLVLWAIPLWLNRHQLVASRPHAWFFGRIKWFRDMADKAPEARITDRELTIIYFLMGVFVFLLFVIQPHGN